MAKIKLGEFRSKESALVNCSLLESHGIEARVVVNDVAGMYPSIGGIDGRPSALFVEESQAEEAREILEAKVAEGDFQEYWDLNHPNHIKNIESNKRKMSSLNRAFYASIIGLVVFITVFQLAAIYWLFRAYIDGEINSQSDKTRVLLSCIFIFIGFRIFLTMFSH